MFGFSKCSVMLVESCRELFQNLIKTKSRKLVFFIFDVYLCISISRYTYICTFVVVFWSFEKSVKFHQFLYNDMKIFSTIQTALNHPWPWWCVVFVSCVCVCLEWSYSPSPLNALLFNLIVCNCRHGCRICYKWFMPRIHICQINYIHVQQKIYEIIPKLFYSKHKKYYEPGSLICINIFLVSLAIQCPLDFESSYRCFIPNL